MCAHVYSQPEHHIQHEHITMKDFHFHVVLEWIPPFCTHDKGECPKPLDSPLSQAECYHLV